MAVEAESAFGTTDGTPLSDAEKELLKEELKKVYLYLYLFKSLDLSIIFMEKQSKK